MPLREPGEPLSHFISRFVGSKHEKREFPKIKQRLAVGYSEAREHARKYGGKVKGKIPAGGNYIVGEEGPEGLHLEPGSKGFVVPNPSTQAKMAHRMLGGAVMNTTTRGFNTSPPMNSPMIPPANQFSPNDPSGLGGGAFFRRSNGGGIQPSIGLRAEGGPVTGGDVEPNVKNAYSHEQDQHNVRDRYLKAKRCAIKLNAEQQGRTL